MRGLHRSNYKHMVKPPINASLDWNNPYTAFMNDCILFNEGGGRVYSNLVDPKAYGTPSGSTSSWENNRQFVGATSTQTSYLSFGRNRLTRYVNNTNNITFRCIVKFNQLVNSHHPVFAKLGDPVGSPSKLEFSLMVNSAGNIPYFNVGTSTSRAGFSSLSTNFVVNRVYDLVWVINGTTFTLYNNGNVIVPFNNFTNTFGNSTTVFDAPGSTDPLIFGADPGDGARWSNNTYYLFQSWIGRALTQVEIRELYNNPFNVASPGKGVSALENSLASAVSYYNRRGGVNYGRVGTRTIFY